MDLALMWPTRHHLSVVNSSISLHRSADDVTTMTAIFSDTPSQDSGLATYQGPSATSSCTSRRSWLDTFISSHSMWCSSRMTRIKVFQQQWHMNLHIPVPKQAHVAHVVDGFVLGHRSCLCRSQTPLSKRTLEGVHFR